MKEKYSAVLLALLGGGVGLHKFYLGKNTAGILYAVFCWTFVPALMAVIDAICYLFMDREEFDERYNVNNCSTADNSQSEEKSEADSVYSSILEAKKLFEDGTISEEEFIQIKSEILGGAK